MHIHVYIYVNHFVSQSEPLCSLSKPAFSPILKSQARTPLSKHILMKFETLPYEYRGTKAGAEGFSRGTNAAAEGSSLGGRCIVLGWRKPSLHLSCMYGDITPPIMKSSNSLPRLVSSNRYPVDHAHGLGRSIETLKR
jgi:hypothetical protein